MHDDAPAAAESVLQSCDLLSHLLSSLDLRQAMLVARTCLAWRDAAYAKRLEWRILSPEFRVGRHGGEEIACTSDSDDDSDADSHSDAADEAERSNDGTADDAGCWRGAESGGPVMVSPTYAAWLPNGGLVVSDSRNGRLQLLDDTGAPCAALPLATGDNALASPFPTGLAWTSDCSSGGGGHGGGGEESADGAADTGGAGNGGGAVFVADRANSRVLKLSLSGAHLASGGEGELLHPDGLALVGALLYVADCNHHRIAVFDAQLRWRFSFGTCGSALGHLRHPNGVAGHSGDAAAAAGVTAGELFVADSDNDRVQVFTLAGRPLRAIGQGGGAPGQFRAPCGVALCRGLLLVSEWEGRRLQVLTQQGEPLQVVTPPGAAELAGLAVCARAARAVAVDWKACQLHVLRLEPAARERAAARAAAADAAARAAAPPPRRLSVGLGEDSCDELSYFSRGIIVMSAQL